MSHLKERKEKNCLNCNAEVMGRFCHICGQENIEPKESVFHLMSHYLQDITHFDGKFFSTLSYLIFRPGFLSWEYIRGRRISYLSPVRMYVFTSAIFFLIFFTVIGSQTEKITEPEKFNAAAFVNTLSAKIEAANAAISSAKDSAAIKKLKVEIIGLQQQLALAKSDSIAGEKLFKEQLAENGFISFADDKFDSRKSYDSLQKALPVRERDNFLLRKLVEKSLEVKEKYKDNPKAVQEKLIESFFHKFPQIMFLSLPFFAFSLKLLYHRHRSLFYINHLIFTIHQYIFSYIALLFLFFCQKMATATHWGVFNVGAVLTGIAIFFYQYKAMRNFYHQRRAKTLLKFFILSIFSSFFMLLLFVLFFLFSFFQI